VAPGGGQLHRGETPATVAAAYSVPFQASAGSRTIAIVSAYENKKLESDLHVFSSMFNLTDCTVASGCLQIVNLGSGAVSELQRCYLAGETILDVEWAHALAPNAKLLVVEAKSTSTTDVFDAISLAANSIKASGGEVSLSLGTLEFPDEGSFDEKLIDGVVYIAATGDSGDVSYPAASPRVVAAGGTGFIRDNSGNFSAEEGWGRGGGGPSKYENRPVFQNGVENVDPTHRSIPDVAALADMNSGAAVYSTDTCSGAPTGWIVDAGTSLAAPIVAARINAAGKFLGSTAAELAVLYGNRKSVQKVRDIVSSSPGRYRATPGYDFVTGIGSLLGLQFDR
jgi:kumamolisin